MQTTAHKEDDLLNSLQFTETELREFRAIAARQQVCQLLSLTEDEHSNFKYNCGRYFLIYLLNNDDNIIARFEKSKLFWGWWGNLYAIRDEVYCEADFTGISKTNRFNIYIQMHDPMRKAHELKIPALIWQETRREGI